MENCELETFIRLVICTGYGKVQLSQSSYFTRHDTYLHSSQGSTVVGLKQTLAKTYPVIAEIEGVCIYGAVRLGAHAYKESGCSWRADWEYLWLPKQC